MTGSSLDGAGVACDPHGLHLTQQQRNSTEDTARESDQASLPAKEQDPACAVSTLVGTARLFCCYMVSAGRAAEWWNTASWLTTTHRVFALD